MLAAIIDEKMSAFNLKIMCIVSLVLPRFVQIIADGAD